MEPKFQTSFIPKSPVITTPSVSSASFSGPRPVSLIPLVANILIVLTVLASGGIFAYEKYLESQIDAASKALVQAQESFDMQTIKTIIASSDRIKSTRGLLTSHTAVSELFSALQQSILPRVTFNSFTFNVDTTNTIKFSAEGLADSYAVAAQQSAVFSKMPFVTKQNFTGLNLTEKGQVGIKMEGVVDKSLVLYEQVVKDKQNTQ